MRVRQPLPANALILGSRRSGPDPRLHILGQPDVAHLQLRHRLGEVAALRDLVAGQKAALGRLRQHQTVTVPVSDTTLAIEFTDGDAKVVRRTTTQPVRSIKGQRPRIATSIS
jgi:hypothetical protein